MEEKYVLKTYHDGKLVDTFETTNKIKMFDFWHRCLDCGDAKEYATYNLSDPYGKLVTKTFYRNKKESVDK